MHYANRPDTRRDAKIFWATFGVDLNDIQYIFYRNETIIKSELITPLIHKN
jgi:hypothetical protein